MAEEDIILRVAVQEDVVSLNPLVGFSHHWTWMMTQWLYDTPVFAGMENKLVPYIAIGSSNDTLQASEWKNCDIGNFSFLPEADWADSSKPEATIYYDFTNVLWHDGVQMDIDDILFSYHVAAQHPVWRGDIECLADQGDFALGNFSETNWLNIDIDWESPDRLNAALSFTLQKPYGAFFERTLAVLLLPEHLWGSSAFNQAYSETMTWCDAEYSPGNYMAWNYSRALEYEPEIPVGNGPFKWGSRIVGKNLTLETWRGHFLDENWKYEEYCLDYDGSSLARQPAIDGLEFQMMKTNEAGVSALLKGLVDYIGWSIPPTFVQELANENGVALSQSPHTGFTYLAYNMNRPSFGYDEAGNDIGKPLREAIAHSIDKNRITQRLTIGFGIGGEGPVSSISSWFNDTLPRYSFDPDESKIILKNAGYILDNPLKLSGNGNYWNNPDESPIGSGPNGTIEILIPTPDENPIASQAGLMICQQLQDIGINAVAVYRNLSQMFEILNVGDYEMCITTWNGGEAEYLMYQMFHSDNIAGNNHMGYQNHAYDTIINWGRAAATEEKRKKAVHDAQGLVVGDLPCDVLYFRTNIEAYRSDKFTGWQVGSSGSILNKASIFNIRTHGYPITASFVSPPSAIVSNSTGNQISVLVRNADGEPLGGAYVVLNASMGKLEAEHGNTSSTGKFTTSYTAPFVDPDDPDAAENGSKVIIQIMSANYYDECSYYEPAPSRLTLITVYPEDVDFLSVTVSADPDIINPDYSEENSFGFTYVDVFVKDQDGDPVSGAIVACEISPAIPDIEPDEAITDANGMARFKIIATDEPNNDTSVVEYQITAYAAYEDYKPGHNSIDIQIVDAAPMEEAAQENSWAYYFVLPASLVGILILMVVMLAYVRRMK